LWRKIRFTISEFLAKGLMSRINVQAYYLMEYVPGEIFLINMFEDHLVAAQYITKRIEG